MVKNYSCRLRFGSGKNRRCLFASSVELVGDDLVIHLSSDRQIVSKALATAAGYAFCECDNLSSRSSHILMEFEAPNDCVPDIDSKRFRDAVRAYLDIYGADNFNSLINGDVFAEVPGNE